MVTENKIFQTIKNTVIDTTTNAKIVLFDFYARGDNNEESDIDLLVLIEKDKLTYADKVKITFP